MVIPLLFGYKRTYRLIAWRSMGNYHWSHTCRNVHCEQKRQSGLGQRKQLNSSLHKRFMEKDRGFSVLSSIGCVTSWAFLQTTRVKELFMCIYSYCESSVQVVPVLNLFGSQCLNIAQHILCRSIGCKLTKFLF